MLKEHVVIIVGGLGDRDRLIKIGTLHWKIYGITPLSYSANWNNDKESFETKLQKLLVLIDQFFKNGKIVSLLGTSAGASLALNAFYLRRKKVSGFINVCGRLKMGPNSGYRSFANMTKTSSAFAQSIKNAEKGIKTLNNKELKRIMTLRSMFGDEFVPPETSTIEGAQNIKVPMIEHSLSIGVTLIFLVNKIASFATEAIN